MTELVPVRRVPRVIDGEVLRPDPAFDGRAVPGTYGAVLRHPLREIRMMPEFDKESRGYQLHPVQCFHRKKGFTPRDGWWCKDCGDPL